jgi:anti-sigma factor RsiW
MNPFPHHIPFRKLSDYVSGDLPLVERVDVDAHIAVCSRCAAELDELERLTQLMRTDTGEDAPPHVIKRALELFRARSEQENPSADLRRRVLAVLHFDSLGLAPAFGVRSGKPGARQLLFSTHVNEIDLRIEPAGQGWLVSGQVLGGATTSGTALLQGATGVSETSLNELNEFALPPVEAGTYKLILNLTDVEVEIEEIRIGS